MVWVRFDFLVWKDDTTVSPSDCTVRHLSETGSMVHNLSAPLERQLGPSCAKSQVRYGRDGMPIEDADQIPRCIGMLRNLLLNISSLSFDFTLSS